MQFDVLYWDEKTQQQRTRKSTSQEEAQRGIDMATDSAPVLAESVPMLNLKLVLGADGKLSAAESLFASMEGEDGALARAYWTSAQNARRDNYLVQQMWPMLYPDEPAFNEAWARAAALNP